MITQNTNFHCRNDLDKQRWEEGWRHLGAAGLGSHGQGKVPL